MKTYFPILLTKAGELNALTRLEQQVKEGIAPIFEVLTNSIDRLQNHLLDQWTFDDNLVLIDFSLFDPFDRTSIRNLFRQLFNNGVNAVPVIQQNSDARYLTLVRTLITDYNCKVCIRTSNGTGGFLNYDATVTNLIGQMGITRGNTLLLIDLGLAETNNHNNLSALAVATIRSITNVGEYHNIIVAASSFPENLSAMVPAGRMYRLQRYEWNIWQAVQSIPEIAGFAKYGDYGTKYPYYIEANFQGTCSIKYSTAAEFVVYRGELSGNHAQGNGQYIIFADRLIRTADYPGNTFSWGDRQIHFYANQTLTDPNRKTGNATNWVEISQNHHITLLHNLL